MAAERVWIHRCEPDQTRKRSCPGVPWKVDFSRCPAKLQIWFMASRTCPFLLQRLNTTRNRSWQVLIFIKISIWWSFKQPVVSCTRTNSSSLLLSPLFAGMKGQAQSCSALAGEYLWQGGETRNSYGQGIYRAQEDPWLPHGLQIESRVPFLPALMWRARSPVLFKTLLKRGFVRNP